MLKVGTKIIPYGCPDCDGDLIIVKMENDISVLKCVECESEYYSTIVSKESEEI